MDLPGQSFGDLLWDVSGIISQHQGSSEANGRPIELHSPHRGGPVTASPLIASPVPAWWLSDMHIFQCLNFLWNQGRSWANSSSQVSTSNSAPGSWLNLEFRTTLADSPLLKRGRIAILSSFSTKFSKDGLKSDSKEFRWAAPPTWELSHMWLPQHVCRGVEELRGSVVLSHIQDDTQKALSREHSPGCRWCHIRANQQIMQMSTHLYHLLKFSFKLPVKWNTF